MKCWFKNTIREEKRKEKKEWLWRGLYPEPISWQGWAASFVYIAVYVADAYFFPPWQRPFSLPSLACFVVIVILNAGLFGTLFFLTKEKE